MQTQNPFLDEMAKLTQAAMGIAQAAGEEAKTALRAQSDKWVADLDLIRRDEFEALRAEIAAPAGGKSPPCEAKSLNLFPFLTETRRAKQPSLAVVHLCFHLRGRSLPPASLKEASRPHGHSKDRKKTTP